MTRTYSLAYLTIPGVTPDEQVHIAHRAGYDAVGLRLIAMGVAGEPDCDPIAPQMLARTRDAMRATGVTCHDIELARILSDETPAHYEPAIAAGAELGARHLISSAWTRGIDDDAYVADFFGDLCDLAAGYGMTVSLEFPSFSRLINLAEAATILRAADRANAGVLIDSLYYHLSHLTPEDLDTIPRDWVRFLHICDAPRIRPGTRAEMRQIAREGRLYPGEGAIDFAPLRDRFPEAAISIELPNAARSAALGHEEHARRCLQAARAIFATGNTATRTGTAG